MPNDGVVLEMGNVQTLPSKFLTLKPTLLYSNTQSLVSFPVIPKCVTLNDSRCFVLALAPDASMLTKLPCLVW